MPLPNANGTLLTISVMGVPYYSARGLEQTYEHIGAAAEIERDVNATATLLSMEQFQKYSSKITCKDQRVPALDGIWPGQIVQVGCIFYLGYVAGGTPQRTAVTDSAFTEEGYTYYRPLLEMMVMKYTVNNGEYSADIAWILDLEEL